MKAFLQNVSSKTLQNKLHFFRLEDPNVNERESFVVDPVSIGILSVLALMFIVICAVLQMFSRYHHLKNICS